MKKNYSEFIMIILTSLILSCNAFWWRTTTEAAPLIRQMPISYFRTYTYHQPIGYPGTLFQSPSYNQYSLPSRFAGWSQFPAASDGVSVLSNYRPETTTVTVLPPTQTTSTTPIPTQAPTLPPPILSTHSPHSQSSVQSPPQSPAMSLPLQSITGQPAQYSLSSSYMSSSGHHYVETHPPSAKLLTSGPIRTSYLTPDYPNQYYYSSPNVNSNSNPTISSTQHHNMNAVPINGKYQRQQIRFVPCMCPVTVAISNEFPESRSTSNDDDDMILPENDDGIVKSKDVEEINVSS